MKIEADAANRALLVAGALLVVLAAAPYRAFDLERFLAPKELALNAVALALALPALPGAQTLELGLVDLLLAMYLTLSAASALFAPDRWPAVGALGVSLSGAALFWWARLSSGATRRTIVAAASAAAVLAAALALAQAYGLRLSLFSPLRLPGGTLGNRNFVAHLAAVCAPALVLSVLRARRPGAVAGAAGMAVLAAILVLTRSRAALLGLGAGAAVLVYGLRRLDALRDARTASRLKALLAAAAVGVLVALLLPNRLEWNSDSPYLDTIAGLADYHEGSGHGRLVQYTRSLRLAAAHPLLGAGPGNWGLVYPRYVRDFDPSIDYATGRAINPWPSSDWVAVLAERGLPAFVALLGVWLCLLSGAWSRAAAAGEDALEGYALAAVLASAAVVGCFDVFLLLPAPSFLLWALAGALASEPPASWTITPSPRAFQRLRLAVALVWGLALLRNSGQLIGMSLFTKAHTRAQLARAGLFDPENARIRSRLEAMR